MIYKASSCGSNLNNFYFITNTVLTTTTGLHAEKGTAEKGTAGSFALRHSRLMLTQAFMGHKSHHAGLLTQSGDTVNKRMCEAAAEVLWYTVPQCGLRLRRRWYAL